MTYFHEYTKTIDATTLNFPPNEPKLNVLSLFSGAGGMDLGFKGGFDYLGCNYMKNPYNLVFANDIFKQAANIYEDNFKHKVERRNIIDLELSEIDNFITEQTGFLYLKLTLSLVVFLVKHLVIQENERD